MNTQDFINMETEYGANNYSPLDVVITKAQGIWVEDVDGKRYMDCLSAYGFWMDSRRFATWRTTGLSPLKAKI